MLTNLSNVTKTGVVIFRPKAKAFSTDLILKMCGKKLYPSHHVKYLRLYLDEFVNWVTYVNQLCVKLVKANTMLSKIQYFVNETTLLFISFAIFNSHLSYVCTACRQSIVPSHRVWILHRTVAHIICFAKFSDHTIQLFHKMKIINFFDLVSIENCIFVNKDFSCKSYSVSSHNHQIRFGMNGLKYYLVAILLNLAQKVSCIPQSLLGILSKLCFQRRISQKCLQ